MAVNVRLVLRNLTGRCQGFIATLKDNFGFIENVDHDKEVFFHFRLVIVGVMVGVGTKTQSHIFPVTLGQFLKDTKLKSTSVIAQD